MTPKQIKGTSAMIALGHKEVKSRSRKYIVFERSDRPGYFIYIGKRGAVRTGKNISSSISIGKVK